MLVAAGQRGVVLGMAPEGEDAVVVRWFEPARGRCADADACEGAASARGPLQTVVRPVVTMRRQGFRSYRGLPVYASAQHLPLALAWAVAPCCDGDAALAGGSCGAGLGHGAHDAPLLDVDPCIGAIGPPGRLYQVLSLARRARDVRLASPLQRAHVRCQRVGIDSLSTGL